ncbi:ABC transporter permease [Bacilli bacterium]|nr:ABC transporter permease [Bacilli bacterium]GHU45894.1 ABC transporter permease [Bacilli bacterium]
MVKPLTPFSKFIIFILTMVAALISNDTRFLGVLALIALAYFLSARLKFAKWLWFLIILHLVIIFSLNPDYGITLYHYNISWIADFTLQEALYLLTIFLKDVIILTFLQIFLLTSQPLEIAASLNYVGLPYRMAYKIGRLFGLGSRFKARYLKLRDAAAAQNLVFSKFDAVRFLLQAKHEETLASRHFGKKQKRTWYQMRPISERDKRAMWLAGFSVIISIILIVVNGGRLWNPFR